MAVHRRPIGVVSDPTALYRCTEGSPLSDGTILWRATVDARGSFPSYQSSPGTLHDARVELYPDFLVLQHASLSFAIPTSAIERVALLSALDRPGGALFQVDYSDANRAIRRIWLKTARGRLPSLSSARLRQIVSGLSQAGIARIETEDIVSGLPPALHALVPSPNDLLRAIWTGDASVSLASGEYPMRLYVLAGWFVGIVADVVTAVRMVDVDGYTLAGEAGGNGVVVYLTLQGPESRIDLRLAFADDEALTAESRAEQFVGALRHQGIAEFQEPGTRDRAPWRARASTENERAVWSPRRSNQRSTYRGLTASALGDSPVSGHIGNGNAHPTRGPRLISTAPLGIGEPHADQTPLPSDARALADDMAFYGQITARLEVFQSLRDAHLVTDQELFERREEVLREVDLTYRLLQLKALREAELITAEEYDVRRRDLVQQL